MRIISGGQTGADQGGLIAAQLAYIETGGFAPKGFYTEKGPNLKLKEWGLVDSGKDYIGRTALNAESSDVTLWFGKNDSPGYYATLRSCKKANKPFIDVTDFSIEQIKNIIKNYSIVNIAGNRESKNIGIQEKVKNIMYEVLK
jgi:hypothetical protein